MATLALVVVSASVEEVVPRVHQAYLALEGILAEAAVLDVLTEAVGVAVPGAGVVS